MSKLAIIGTGQVGATIAYTAQMAGICTDMILVNDPHEKAVGEALDLGHALPFVKPVDIRAGGWEDCAGADVAVIAAGGGRREGESRLDLLARNVKVIEEIAGKIAAHMPTALIVVVSNPLDVMTRVLAARSGLPRGRVIGSGTVLDTARFRFLLAERLGVDARNVHAYVLGEHGDSQVHVWSQVNVAGVPLERFSTDPAVFGPDFRERIAEEVRGSGARVIAGKGATTYGVSQAVLRIITAMLRDESSLLTVSLPLEGEYGIEGVCLSVPCIVNHRGAARILPMPLDDDEMRALAASAEVVRRSAAAAGY
jgi:L-lactate dehydrogenase